MSLEFIFGENKCVKRLGADELPQSIGSVSAWFKALPPPMDASRQSYILVTTNSTVTTKLWLFSLYVENDEDRFAWKLNVQYRNGGAIYTCATDNTWLPAGSIDLWHHFGVTFNGTNFRFYIDGVYYAPSLIPTVRSWWGAITGRNNFAIGLRQGPTTGTTFNFFHGSIYDTRVYNRVISDAEMLEIYEKTGIDTVTSGRVLRLQLSEKASGQQANDGPNSILDTSGSGLHFSPVLAPYYRSNPLPLCAKPVISPPDGSSNAGHVHVAITCATPGSAIHYTTDGSSPDINSPIYTEAFNVYSGSNSVKAIAYASGFDQSKIATATYLIDDAVQCGLQINPANQNFSGSMQFYIHWSTLYLDSISVFYTIDGTAPTASSTPAILDDLVTINSITIIRAIAICNEAVPEYKGPVTYTPNTTQSNIAPIVMNVAIADPNLRKFTDVGGGLYPITKRYWQIIKVDDGLANGIPAFPPPILWWMLNETSGNTAHDISGNGHNGNLGGWTTGWTVRDGFNCLLFNGIDNVVSGPNLGGTVPTALTISIWVNINSSEINALSVPWNLDFDGVYLGIVGGATSRVGATLGFYNNAGAPIDNLINSGWHHIVYVADSVLNQPNGRLFYDGQLVALVNGAYGNLSYNMHLGFRRTSFMLGALSDFRVWNIALTNDQVRGVFLRTDTAYPGDQGLLDAQITTGNFLTYNLAQWNRKMFRIGLTAYDDHAQSGVASMEYKFDSTTPAESKIQIEHTSQHYTFGSKTLDDLSNVTGYQWKLNRLDELASTTARWLMDEMSGSVVADATGNGHTGTISGAIWNIDGRNGCLQFSNPTDKVVFGSNVNLLPDYLTYDIGHNPILAPYSISFWIKIEKSDLINGTATIMSMKETGGSLHRYFHVYATGLNEGYNIKHSYFLNDTDGFSEFAMQYSQYDEDITNGGVLHGTMSYGDWHHVVILVMGDLINLKSQFYIDKVLNLWSYYYIEPYAEANTNPNFTIGQASGTGVFPTFKGKIDDVRIFKGKFLVQNEINSLYGNGKVKTELVNVSGVTKFSYDFTSKTDLFSVQLITTDGQSNVSSAETIFIPEGEAGGGGQIDLDFGWQLIAVPIKFGYWDMATHSLVHDGVTIAKVKNYIADQLEDKYGAPLASKVELFRAYIGGTSQNYTYYHGITPPSSVNNFPLEFLDPDDGNYEPVGFWVKNISGIHMTIDWGVV